MELIKHLPKRAVLPTLKATTKVDVLREMSEALLSGKNKSLRGSVLEQIVSRESLESTALGHGIALPHARVAGLDDLVCAMAVSKKGVDFRAVDDRRVHLVFLMLYPPTKQSAYLNFVAGVVRALHESDRVQQLIDAGDAESMLEVLGAGAGETQAAVTAAMGKKAGIDAPALSRLESGKVSNPTIDTLTRVAAALGLEVICSLREVAATT